MAKKTNFESNGKNYFRTTATIGVGKDGERIRKAFYGSSKKEAEAKRDAFIKGINRGLDIDYDKILFSDKFKEWLFIVKKPSLSDGSFERYEQGYRLRLKKAEFFHKPLIQVKSIDIQKFYNTLTPTQAYNMNGSLVSCFFKYCVAEQIIDRNPCLNLSLPKDKSVKVARKEFLTLEDVNTLEAVFNNNTIYLFALLTGMRQGEILSVTYNDIDFNDNLISVNKTLSRRKEFDNDGGFENKTKITSPKTDSSIRQVPISIELIGPLKKHIAREKEKHIKFGIPFSENQLVFTSQSLTPLRGDHVNERWKKAQSKFGIKPVRFHDLRATFGTLAAAENVPVKVLSEIMGHSNPKTTFKYYIHADLQHKQEAVYSISKIIMNQ